MPKRDLYERCRACEGTRELKYPAHVDRTRTDSTILHPGATCPVCRDGYVATGMTAGQAERLVRENERLRLEVAELRKWQAEQQRRLLGDPDGAF